ncbi:MAG: glycosyltransferase family 2 protein [Candidatus Aenigmatarchaeota archaeon]
MENFTVIIPVYNEEDCIEENTIKLVDFLDMLDVSYEIIIGNNGSKDSTPRKGRELSKRFPRRVTFFTVREKGAVGTVFKEAVSISKYDNIISIDMDLTTDLNFIPECAKLLEENDMIIGSKKMGSQERPFIRKIASRVFTNLTKCLLGVDFEDFSLGCKGYRKDSVIKYFDSIDKGSSYVIYLAYYLVNEDRSVKEIPVSCSDKRDSKFNIVDESVYRLRKLLKFWLLHKKRICR